MSEAELQPLTGETMENETANKEDGACLDITANRLWGSRHERIFVDVRIFNPYAPIYSNTPMSSNYKRHEKMKKRAYDQRVREIKHATFIPIVLSATGGMGNQATHFYKRIAKCLASKWDQPYSSIMSWLRCKLTFSLLRLAIQCLRGARSSTGHPHRSLAMDLITAELHLRKDISHFMNNLINQPTSHHPCSLYIQASAFVSKRKKK